MASSIYSEVTSVSTGVGYERDRVLDKLVDATKDLPYTVDDNFKSQRFCCCRCDK